MNKKSIFTFITVAILSALVVYNVIFVRIGDKMVSRYTDTFRITQACNEKEQRKIRKLKKLTALEISSEADVRSLDFVYDLSSLKKLNIGCSRNLDMSFLSECSELEILNIFGITLDSFEQISTLTMLKDIDLWICETYDISGIKNLKELRTFSLNNGNSGSITGLEELAELPELTSISLSYSKKSDITAIAECKNLTSLSLTDSDESIDINELIKLEKLEKLYIAGSSLENAEKLLEFNELRYITFSEDMVDNTLINSLKRNNVTVQLL